MALWNFRRVCAFAFVFAAALLLASCFSIPNEGTVRLENACAAYAEVADEYFALAQYGDAAQYYQKARQAEKFYDAMTYKLACCYALDKSYELALPLFGELLEKDAANRTLRESAAYCTVMSGDFAAGSQMYQSLAAENPQDGRLFRSFVQALLLSENLGAAEEQLGVYKSRFGADDYSFALQNRIAAKKNGEPLPPPVQAEKPSEGEAPAGGAPVPEEDFDMPDWTTEDF